MRTPYPDNCPPGNQRETDNKPAKDWYDFVPPAPPTTVTLAFNLDNPEGERRLRECLDAPRVKSAVWDFDRWMRNRIKYNPDSETDPLYISEDGIAWLEIARDQLNMRLEDCGIDIWDD